MKKTILIFFLFLVPLFNNIAQITTGKYHTREVIIQLGDTIIKANILTGELKKRIRPDRVYFWYSKNTINSNLGGYAGKLFHGPYTAFYENKLIESGEFSKGLKTGAWKIWYLNGRIKEIHSWKDGMLSGHSYWYSGRGNLETELIYRKGKLVSRPNRFFSLFIKKDSHEEKPEKEKHSKKVKDKGVTSKRTGPKTK